MMKQPLYETSSDIKQLYNSINANLNILAVWFRANKLSLNIHKTIYMIFGKTLIKCKTIWKLYLKDWI